MEKKRAKVRRDRDTYPSSKLRVLSALCTTEFRLRDWSKSMGGGGGGPEHLEMWLIKNT